MSTVVDTDSEQVLQVAGPLQLPPRTHAELHDELHARPPLRTTACCVVSYWAQAGLPAEVAEGEHGEELWIRAVAVSHDGRHQVRCQGSGDPADAPGIGNRLAELQLKILWQEILKRFDAIEVTGPPKRLLSNFVRGISELPVRIPG